MYVSKQSTVDNGYSDIGYSDTGYSDIIVPWYESPSPRNPYIIYWI